MGVPRTPIVNPYPHPGWKAITNFSYDSDLHIMRLRKSIPGIRREAQYIVAKDYTVSFDLDGARKSITVPRGMLTDLSSAPRLFRGLVGRVGPHLEATIVHDYLYVAWQILCVKANGNMLKFADELMFVAMKAAGMKLMAWAIYVPVFLAGRGVFFGKDPGPFIVCSECLPTCYCCHKTDPEKPPALCA